MPHRQSVTTQAETTDPLINSKNNQHAFPACFALNQQHIERGIAVQFCNPHREKSRNRQTTYTQGEASKTGIKHSQLNHLPTNALIKINTRNKLMPQYAAYKEGRDGQ
jgi:hypothetical protein